MSKRRRAPVRRGVEDLIKTLKSESAVNVILLLLVVAIVLMMSGVVYSFTAENAISIAFLPGGAVRVFLWSLSAQSHAETLVIAIYYLMGVGGVWLYLNAVSKPFNPRNTKYMLFFSFLLLLLAGIGLYNAYVAKFQRPG